MAPLSSQLLTFATPFGRSAIPPSTTHLLGSTAYPAPAQFLPLHYARIFLSGSDRSSPEQKTVLWIDCHGSGAEHVRGSLRRNGTKFTSHSFIYIDALQEILRESASSAALNFSHSASLQALLQRVEIQLSSLSPSFNTDTASETESGDDLTGSNSVEPMCMVIINDASSLAWNITALDEDTSMNNGSIDARVKLLRSRKDGVIQSDAIGTGLAKWIDEHLQRVCVSYGAVLFTHFTSDSTTITSPASNTQSTRKGGSYGVGTGFDADDAGEENEEEEIYDDVEDLLEEQDSEASLDVETTSEKSSKVNPVLSFPKDSIDWRSDSFLRTLLPKVDFWIEVRGLRSGKARDCHGEICLHSLFRPCMARQQPLPRLPIPSDPLKILRSKDRISHPLANLSSLSISATGLTTAMAAQVWAFDSACVGRENAMLFRVEALGEAIAWTRQSKS